MTKKSLRNKLKVYRAMEDWTQEELARRVNVTRKTINTIENGKYVPSTYLALKIAAAFGVTVEDLFQLDDEEMPDRILIAGSLLHAPSGSRAEDACAHIHICCCSPVGARYDPTTGHRFLPHPHQAPQEPHQHDHPPAQIGRGPCSGRTHTRPRSARPPLPRLVNELFNPIPPPPAASSPALFEVKAITAGRSNAFGSVKSPVVSNTVARSLAVSNSPKVIPLVSSVPLITGASPKRLVSGPVRRPLGDSADDPDDGQYPADLLGPIAILCQRIIAKDPLEIGQAKADQERHAQANADGAGARARGARDAAPSARSWIYTPFARFCNDTTTWQE